MQAADMYAAGKNRAEEKMDRAIITVVGKDRVGIIAAVCTYLAEHHANILEISQSIVAGFFNMVMVIDIKELDAPFSEMQKELSEVGAGIGVEVKCQREEIFTAMHRI